MCSSDLVAQVAHADVGVLAHQAFDARRLAGLERLEDEAVLQRRDAQLPVLPVERAAVAGTEALTLVSTNGVPDEVYRLARAHFNEKALVDLTLAIIAINGWNRMNVAFRTPVGDYVSPHATR